MNIDVPMSAALAKTTLIVRMTGRRRWTACIWVGSRVLRLGATIIGTGMHADLGTIDENHAGAHESCATTHEKARLTLD
ncbi:hypothetical protein [Sphingomonas sp. Leaf242]|uniref:hypothetical protein n=1 Tax=Sphingomonas sp. Leaf242 TaxID=1736304 RepID=UPI0007139A7E|nr:hypothetical protein [Sphingomonas sp. Leaf242]KQO13269.1 hypothetical protein ASF09_03195 [Sphingomonas sp. Leaf242]